MVTIVKKIIELFFLLFSDWPWMNEWTWWWWKERKKNKREQRTSEKGKKVSTIMRDMKTIMIQRNEREWESERKHQSTDWQEKINKKPHGKIKWIDGSLKVESFKKWVENRSVLIRKRNLNEEKTLFSFNCKGKDLKWIRNNLEDDDH